MKYQLTVTRAITPIGLARSLSSLTLKSSPGQMTTVAYGSASAHATILTSFEAQTIQTDRIYVAHIHKIMPPIYLTTYTCPLTIFTQLQHNYSHSKGFFSKWVISTVHNFMFSNNQGRFIIQAPR